jgi:hypothetical protein
LSNSKDEVGLSLAVAFAREFAELIGGNPSRLYQWGKDLGLPMPARQTFYSRLQRDGWKMESAPSSRETCRLGSYPLNCELRLRVVSLVTQFSRDIRAGKKRQLIVLLGYEICSHLIHFRVYRGDDVEISKHEEIHGITKCEVLPVATVAAFVKECGRMVGLPLQRVLLTQKLMNFQPARGKALFLSLTELGKVTARERQDEIDNNEVLCSFASEHPYRTLDGKHPFIDWCGTTNATKLTADLSDLIKRHNNVTALPHLDTAQQVLDALLKKSSDTVDARRGTSTWGVPPTPFEARLMKHDYALERFSLRDVRYFKRPYEDFKVYPGDSATVAE